MSSKSYKIVLWSSVLGTLALVILGMVWLAKGGGQPNENVYVPGINEILADDHVYGPATAKVTLVEYADFQCPACGAEYPTIAKLMADYGSKVRFVYRNFPIPGHLNGPAAAYAAGAAGLQGKFFEMENLLFTHQNDWAEVDNATLMKTLDGYAQNLGLKMDKFHTDEASDVVKAKVDKDAQSGVKAGVDSTPTFFVNGTLSNSRTYDEFKSQFDNLLKS